MNEQQLRAVLLSMYILVAAAAFVAVVGAYLHHFAVITQQGRKRKRDELDILGLRSGLIAPAPLAPLAAIRIGIPTSEASAAACSGPGSQEARWKS